MVLDVNFKRTLQLIFVVYSYARKVIFVINNSFHTVIIFYRIEEYWEPKVDGMDR